MLNQSKPLSRIRHIRVAFAALLLVAGGAQAQTPATQPAKTQPAKPATSKPAAKPAEVSPTSKRVFIDINHAGLEELKRVPGIGTATAKKIIAGRPYANKTQLVSRKIIEPSLYETIQGMIIAKQ